MSMIPRIKLYRTTVTAERSNKQRRIKFPIRSSSRVDTSGECSMAGGRRGESHRNLTGKNLAIKVAFALPTLEVYGRDRSIWMRAKRW
jgi:hypothetical protein